MEEINKNAEYSMNEWFEEVEKQHKRDARVLRAVESVMGDEFYEDLVCFMGFANNFDFRIVREPIGDPQYEGELLGDVYVDQSGPGMSGDDFHGTICVELTKGRYLMFDYNC